MKSFADKVKDSRVALGLSQTQLAEMVGLTSRAVQTYEQGERVPRATTMHKLAKALQVSVRFLTDDECEDPTADIEMDGYIEEAREKYGSSGARDVQTLLQANTALFAGGELSQEQKDAFFDAVMKAYVLCKEEAKEKFTPKSLK